MATRDPVPPSHRTTAAPAPAFCADRAACPVCDAVSTDQSVLFTKQLATFVECRRCGFVFINPRPSAAWLAERYDYYGDAYFTARTKLASDFNAARHQFELTVLRSATGKLLDVGCATGSFVAAARAAGFDAHGIDVSFEATRYGREVLALPLEGGDLYERRYSSETFDVVTLWATLEHLVDPNRFLSEAHRLLVSGGRLALSVPNHGSLTQKLLGRRNRYVGIDHVNYFTAATLRRMLGRHGFSTVTLRTGRFSPVVFWQDLTRGGPEGASLERQLADQLVTDRFKYRGGVFAAARVGHTMLTNALGAIGLGNMLYVVALKAVAR